MAGIGFELRKLFRGKGLLSAARAYGYTAIVCTGPVILGILLLLCVRLLASWGGALRQSQDFLVSMITYALLASLIFSNIFSLITTRFAADMQYMQMPERVLPSLFGSTAILLIAGGLCYGVFLLFSGIAWYLMLLCLVLFCELVVVWAQISYITAVKDYRAILLVFVAGILLAVAAGLLLIGMGMEVVAAMMTAVCTGYGAMMVGYYLVLLKYFPHGDGGYFDFIEWVERYPSLVVNGVCTSIGLFSHLVIVWFSPMGVQVQGLFYSAPLYDIPALVAFLTTFITTVSFVTSTEVQFYPKYRRYFDLMNAEGTMTDIEMAEQDLIRVLRRELSYLALKQFVVSAMAIAIGGVVLPATNLGFNASMLGTFRVLCIGYGIYAIANSLMLILLYFTDYDGALLAVTAFAIISTVATIILLQASFSFYGFGFILGAAAMYATVFVCLRRYVAKLQYNVFASQPILGQGRRIHLRALHGFLVRWFAGGTKKAEYGQVKQS